MADATEVKVPDIGGFSEVPVIEVHVNPGDRVDPEDPLVTLESDKATMDVPAPAAGAVVDVLVKVGDEVSEGTPILLLAPGEGALTPPPSLVEQQVPQPAAPAPAVTTVPAAPGAPVPATAAAPSPPEALGVHAGPSVRRMAREFGIDLAAVTGTGPKGRITKDDLLGHVRGPAAAPAAAVPAGTGIPEIPAQDFAQFGTVTTRPLSRIKKLSGPLLHRSWLNVPHVTHDDEADITDLERYRKDLDTAAKAATDGGPYRVTLLAFLVKAAVSALKKFPEFNSSLSPEQDALILKEYYNIGIAVDTPDGLVVPVVRDADRKGIVELSREFGTLSAKARDGKLSPTDMAGGTFTISSLGGIGGTGFTPIVNAPEVAILGVVRSRVTPVWDGSAFQPRLMLPISLSYDHRVIDGALAARFARHLCHLLEDDRRLLL
ncbi:branched-chain alpha-keto acid dehydrogenase subunit E2 [Pseudonocardia sp. K10HN5]|uniref:Dihydrolipoamide acetyltransferase component of pyruvate dehydrogenase complex n=1 Tax=Pseudonocardia acidicola TaxID=2724939 RepID=A0ABX1SEL7_9PSEU|nr:branched-chain alpha-keto acid dehydrogenase subunit E2 [Pseudonocardia acidicola]